MMDVMGLSAPHATSRGARLKNTNMDVGISPNASRCVLISGAAAQYQHLRGFLGAGSPNNACIHW